MKSLLAPILIGSVMFCLAGSAARADEMNKKTTVTFSAPIEIPGRVLPAGTYVFKLMDSPADRHIVEIYNNKETHLITTVAAIPDERLEPTGKTVITFDERPAGTPIALRAWFYPGDNVGQEFVYPESKAREIAKRSNQHVLYMRDHEGDMRKGEVRAMEPSGQEVDVREVHHK